ncbi:MAG: Rne/Rng family ribonuclease [Acidobacteriia bacterium]|nr:Rne/Rng family ribonuclease [Terriglobia bacterium]
MSWVQEAPLIPNQPETFEQVERILSILDVQVESVQPPTKLEPAAPPADLLEKDSIIPLDVIVPGTPEPVSPPVTETAASVSEPVELTEEPISLLLEESEPLDDSPIVASITTTDSAAMVREAQFTGLDMPEAIDAWREPVEPVSLESADSTGSGSAPAIPTSEVHEGSEPTGRQTAEGQEESRKQGALPFATATSEPPNSESEETAEQPAVTFGATVSEQDILLKPGSERGETLAAALPHVESPEQSDEPRIQGPEQPILEEARGVEASTKPPEPAEQITETPTVAGLGFQVTGPETRLPEVPPVATSVVAERPASLTAATSKPPFKEEAKRERVESRFERSSTSKLSPAARRFEAKGGKAAAQLAPQPEVYGPPTPYEYMTDVEKSEYNARRAQEKTSAKILDSSRKLTAPQPRDFGFQRGRRGRRGRSKRFADHETPSEQPAPREERRPTARPLIADLLREGQEILVQIAKEPLGKKGARITSHIALPGRYLVYMPTVDHIGVSRKIGSDEERRRLKRIINEFGEGLPGGFIVRTAGEGRTEEELKQDIRFLANTWTDIRSRAEKRAAPALLHRDLGVLERILRDQLSSEFTAIRLDTETEYAKVLEFVNQFQPALVGRVKLHFKDTPIFEEYGVDHEIEKALKPKVWLKSGGYIVINQTEAMVAIDVNTGKFVGKTTRLEDTIVKTNIDAAKEVARQIRLRDMGGIIVIDFIDMEERKNRQKVIQALEEAMRQDRAPSKILSFNDFGLVALTRKRVKQSLEKILMQPCVFCQGHGLVKSVQTVCYEIQSEAKKMAPLLDGREIRIRVHPEVARALKTSEQTVVSEIESHTRKDVIIKADPQTHQDQFEIF